MSRISKGRLKHLRRLMGELPAPTGIYYPPSSGPGFDPCDRLIVRDYGTTNDSRTVGREIGRPRLKDLRRKNQLVIDACLAGMAVRNVPVGPDVVDFVIETRS